jgi:hypothetical protein
LKRRSIRKTSVGPGYIAFALCVVSAAASAAALPLVIESARVEFQRHLWAESAGVFWIAAEVAILFFMGVAARILEVRPLPQAISLTRTEVRRAWRAGALILVLAAFVFGRHLLWLPLPAAFEAIALSGHDVLGQARNVVLARAHTHAALWCTLITAWMVLEIAIVIQGVRVFGRLRAIVEETRGVR